MGQCTIRWSNGHCACSCLAPASSTDTAPLWLWPCQRNGHARECCSCHCSYWINSSTCTLALRTAASACRTRALRARAHFDRGQRRTPSLTSVTDGVSARAGLDLIDFPTTTPSCKCTNSSTNYASRSLTDTQRLRSRSKMQVPRSPPAHYMTR